MLQIILPLVQLNIIVGLTRLDSSGVEAGAAPRSKVAQLFSSKIALFFGSISYTYVTFELNRARVGRWMGERCESISVAAALSITD